MVVVAGVPGLVSMSQDRGTIGEGVMEAKKTEDTLVSTQVRDVNFSYCESVIMNGW